MKRNLLILALMLLFVPFAFGQTLSDSISLKKISGGHATYQNGSKLNMVQLAKTLESNPEALKQFKSAKTSRTITSIISATGGFMIGWPIGAALGGGKPNWTMAGIGVGLVGVAIPISHSSNKKFKSAIKTYNDGLKTAPVLDKKDIKVSMTGNGVGLIMTF